jgi:hypothetical protein
MLMRASRIIQEFLRSRKMGVWIPDPLKMNEVKNIMLRKKQGKTCACGEMVYEKSPGHKIFMNRLASQQVEIL